MAIVSLVLEDCEHLAGVKAIWRQNSQVLGWYTNGAFDERARRGQIFGAFEDELLVGYVLFYKTKSQHIRITHLCVSEENRGKKIASELISALVLATKSCHGIGLHCRRDFPAWRLWPKLGFHSLKSKVGRSKEGHELTFYWLTHPHKTLFSEYEEIDDDKVTLVLDANVFYDLLDPERMEGGESLGLTADWLQPSVRFFVTPELFNEINRNPNADERAERMSAARQYELAESRVEEFKLAVASVELICGRPANERDEADQRQLAWTIAYGCDVFVTRDHGLLGFSDPIYEQHGVTVERPSEIIARFEEIRNEHQYQRDRLNGTDIRHARQLGDAELLAHTFSTANGTESKGELVRLLNRAFANPDRHDCRVIYAADGRPICMYLVESPQPDTSVVSLFRVARSELFTRLGNTVARTVLATIIKEAAGKRQTIVRLSDRSLVPVITSAAREQRFLQDGDEWVKLCLQEVVSLQSLRQRLSDRLDQVNQQGTLAATLDALEHSGEHIDAQSILEVERTLWPGKISGGHVPCYIVPIRAEWAADLFDGRLANQRLWAADIDLVLNPDSVYYRAARPSVLEGGGRILWYVSEGRYQGSKMLRACSQLVAVETGSPKELFRKYRRLGVYEWRHVVETAKGHGQLMAIEFTDTELFNSPLDWETLQAILTKHGKQNYTFPSPVKIDEALFFDLYNAGSTNR